MRLAERRGRNSRFRRKTAARRRFSCDLRFPFNAICAIGWWVISVGGRGGETTGRSSKRSVTAGAGRDYRSGPSAGAAGPRDRLGVSRSALCQRLHARSGPTWPTDPAGGGAVHPEAHAQLSDEVLSARWLENPYYQFFCGELRPLLSRIASGVTVPPIIGHSRTLQTMVIMGRIALPLGGW